MFQDSSSSVAQWSRGMIPALGAGGPGFKSRLGPFFLCFNTVDSAGNNFVIQGLEMVGTILGLISEL